MTALPPDPLDMSGPPADDEPEPSGSAMLIVWAAGAMVVAILVILYLVTR